MKQVKMKRINKFKPVLSFFQNSSISVYAAKSAYFLILSVFPFLMFFFTLLNFTNLTEEDVILWGSTIIPDAFMNLAHRYIHEIYTGSIGSKMSITIIIAIYLSSKSFLSIQEGLNAMYGVKETRNAFVIRVWACFYSIAFAFMLIVVLSFLVFGNWIADQIANQMIPSAPVWEGVFDHKMIILIPVLFLFFWNLYYWLPNKKLKWKGQIKGALIVAIAWVIFAFFFSIYVDNFSNYASFYGTMTTIALIMLWLYWCMYMLLLGGLYNSWNLLKEHKYE